MTYKKLREEYRKNGISLVYNKYRKLYHLSIDNAPSVAEGIDFEKGEHGNIIQCTGSYLVYLKDQLLDIESMTKEVFDAYKHKYKDNEKMLAYVE